MKCQDCNSEMKPLLTGLYCPNDCDRKVVGPLEDDTIQKIQRVVGTPAVVPSLFDDEDLDSWIDSVFNDQP